MADKTCRTTSSGGGNRQGEDFHAVERQYADLVFGTALRWLQCRHMAEEVTQDVFVLLAKRSRNGRLQNPGGWLRRTAGFKARERLRAESRYRRRIDEYARRHAESPGITGGRAEIEQMLELLEKAMARLPERDRCTLFLRYFEGLDARGIAVRLGITPESAQKQCERARSRLAGKLAAMGVCAAGLARAQAALDGATGTAFAPLMSRLSPLLRGDRLGFRRWAAWCGAAIGLTAAIAFVFFSGRRESENGGVTQSEIRPAPLVAASGTPMERARPIGSASQRPGKAAPAELDLSALAVLLERADESDAVAAVAAETILARHEIDELRRAASSIPELALSVNQLRVLALGVLRHLVSRDGRAAVLAGEQMWRAQHGGSAPVLASLVNEALAKWIVADPAAASRWYEAAAAEGLFEDRGINAAVPADQSDEMFQRALEMERQAVDLSARVALAQSLLQPKQDEVEADSWEVMADVWAHKLTREEAKELADTLWARSDLPMQPVFQLRLALVALPTEPPSIESLRWAATQHGQQQPDAVLAADVTSAWQQRDPAGTASWLATLEGTSERAVILPVRSAGAANDLSSNHLSSP